ncbi:hypothetical protein CCHR01_19594 [Colletotrichum chrysophilum]|uniref:C2H2-type domain-containing protein n=1 Tax=Colletotrichum chrysophilum TaxID=1836956 RepID=A0AAD8ZYB4_9PEZI|nr:hypothetical protein CCHR01_19594 [Colletotrichum chrysophilum]
MERGRAEHHAPLHLPPRQSGTLIRASFLSRPLRFDREHRARGCNTRRRETSIMSRHAVAPVASSQNPRSHDTFLPVIPVTRGMRQSPNLCSLLLLPSCNQPTLFPCFRCRQMQKSAEVKEGFNSSHLTGRYFRLCRCPSHAPPSPPPPPWHQPPCPHDTCGTRFPSSAHLQPHPSAHQSSSVHPSRQWRRQDSTARLSPANRTAVTDGNGSDVRPTIPRAPASPAGSLDLHLHVRGPC